jgi:hypothetical protein
VVLSKRERYIAIAVVAVLGVLGLDRFFVSPLLARMQEANKKVEDAEDKLKDADRLFDRNKHLNRKWANMGGKALKASQSEAEGQLLSTINDWARRSGMNLVSVQPQRTEKDRGFLSVTYRATGSGRVSEIRDFLSAVDRASIPVSITDMTIQARREGTDDLSISMSIATISDLGAPADKPGRAN